MIFYDDFEDFEFPLPSSEKELVFKAKIDKMAKLLDISQSEATGIVLRTMWANITRCDNDGNFESVNSSDIEEVIDYNKRYRLFGVLIVSGFLSPDMLFIDFPYVKENILKLYDKLTGQHRYKDSQKSKSYNVGARDAYADDNSFDELLSALDRYKLNYDEKCEIALLTISYFAEYFCMSVTSDDVRNMYLMIRDYIVKDGKASVSKDTCRLLEEAFECCRFSDAENKWRYLRRFWRVLKENNIQTYEQYKQYDERE